MNIKILTVFSPGSYGTYLSWAVNSYSNLNISREIHKPFGNNGSAHLYRRDLDKKKVKPSHLIKEDYKNIILIRNQMLWVKNLQGHEFYCASGYIQNIRSNLKPSIQMQPLTFVHLNQ